MSKSMGFRKVVEKTYNVYSNDPKYVSIYGKMAIFLGPGVSTRDNARKFAKYKAEKEGWSDYHIKETTCIKTTVEI